MTAGSHFLRGIVLCHVALSAVNPASAAGWLEKASLPIGPRYDGCCRCEAGLGWIAPACPEGRPVLESDLQT
jgi:hypothetical protein